MNTYECRFTARTIGAIGIASNRVVTIEADSREDARLKLYDSFEHIQDLRITNITRECPGFMMAGDTALDQPHYHGPGLCTCRRDPPKARVCQGCGKELGVFAFNGGYWHLPCFRKQRMMS